MLEENNYGLELICGTGKHIYLAYVAGLKIRPERMVLAGICWVGKCFANVSWQLILSTAKRVGLDCKERQIVLHLYQNQYFKSNVNWLGKREELKKENGMDAAYLSTSLTFSLKSDWSNEGEDENREIK